MFYIRHTLFLLVLGCFSTLAAQGDYRMKANSDETEIDFLSSYYSQDGNNSPVTGGIGTEELSDVATVINLYIPIDSVKALTLYLGADAYSSASTDNIDNNVSSASSSDTRIYGTASYQRKNLDKGITYGVRAGFSREYDYNSISAGVSFAKEFNEGNSELNLTGQVFFDRWDLIYPIELRNNSSLPTANRRSYNLQATWSQVVNQRMQFSLSGEAIYMNGLLSTPFHRVYFSDLPGADIERLPDTRLKIPLGFRFHYFPFDPLVLRTYYRFYYDDWGIAAHTFSIETPIKISTAFSVEPFYRYHTQTAADYFAPFEAHFSTDPYYTSDFDLSALNSHKFGMGLTYSPVGGMGALRLPGESALQLKSIALRGAYYSRSTGLNSYIFSLNLKMGIRGKRK